MCTADSYRSKHMMRCERRTTQVAELKERSTPQTSVLVDRQIKVGDTGKSIEAHGATYESRSLAGSLFRAIGFGLGIAGLCVTALTLVLAPVLVVEPNQWIRDLELFWIGVGLAALTAELFVTKS